VQLPISASNVPASYLQFSEKKPIYWEVGMISFSKSGGKLRLKVLDYNAQKVAIFNEQEAKYPIKSVEFEPLHWSELERLLSTYQKSYIKNFITEEDLPKLLQKTFEIPVKVSLNKVKFKMGYVSFRKKFKWNKEGDIFRIAMPDSIPEYEYIKSYFSKILGKTSIEAILEVVSSAKETKLSSVKSIDLEKINDDSIRVLKVQKLDQWSSKKPKYAAPDQDLFTFEEVMERYGDEALGNIDILEKDLLFHLLEKEDVRNKMQLQYLSDRIQAEGEKLLMTLVPQFGFVFVNKGVEMTHYIWELLNSHATYVWSLPNGTSKNNIKLVENEIRTINVHGRTAYKDSFQPSHALFFHPLRHRSSSFSYEQYFAKWKKNLDNLLI